MCQGYLGLCCLNTICILKTNRRISSAMNLQLLADIFVITESWLSERYVADKAHITLPGYKLFEHQRVGRKGGGITLLLNETVDARKGDCGERSSFSLVNGLLNTGLVWLH